MADDAKTAQQARRAAFNAAAKALTLDDCTWAAHNMAEAMGTLLPRTMSEILRRCGSCRELVPLASIIFDRSIKNRTREECCKDCARYCTPCGEWYAPSEDYRHADCIEPRSSDDDEGEEDDSNEEDEAEEVGAEKKRARVDDAAV